MCYGLTTSAEQTITIPTNAVAFDNAPVDQFVAGRKVFVVVKEDGSTAVLIGAVKSCDRNLGLPRPAHRVPGTCSRVRGLH